MFVGNCGNSPFLALVQHHVACLMWQSSVSVRIDSERWRYLTFFLNNKFGWWLRAVSVHQACSWKIPEDHSYLLKMLGAWHSQEIPCLVTAPQCFSEVGPYRTWHSKGWMLREEMAQQENNGKAGCSQMFPKEGRAGPAAVTRVSHEPVGTRPSRKVKSAG